MLSSNKGHKDRMGSFTYIAHKVRLPENFPNIICVKVNLQLMNVRTIAIRQRG